MCWLVQEKVFLARRKVFSGGQFHKCSHTCCIYESGWSHQGDELKGALSRWRLRHTLQYTSPGSPKRWETTRSSHWGEIWILLTRLRLLTVWKSGIHPWTIFSLRTSFWKNPFSASSCFLTFWSGLHNSKITIYGTARSYSGNFYSFKSNTCSLLLKPPVAALPKNFFYQ